MNEAVKVQGKQQRSGKAWRGFSLIQKLFRVERLMKDAAPEPAKLIRSRHRN